MLDDAELVSRANALISRRRSFVARPATPADIEPAVPPAPAPEPVAAEEEDDLPVLTEVIPPATAAPPDRLDETLLSIIATDLVHSIERQLAVELPTLIEAALLNAQNELRTGIGSTLEMALRDFLARRQQLNLPLDEPGRGD